jgi:hypothetical protein
LIRFDEGRKSMFTYTDPAAHCIFADDRYFHKIPPVTWKIRPSSNGNGKDARFATRLGLWSKEFHACVPKRSQSDVQARNR